MRWQRQAQAFLDRFCDLTASPDRLAELGGIVVPTVLLGWDRSDDERATFTSYGEVNPPAGQFVIGTLAAAAGDLEVIDAWGSAVGGNFELGWGIVPTAPGAPSTTFGSCSGPSHAQVSTVTAGGGLGFPAGVRGNTNTVVHLPGCAGMLLERGRMLYVQHTNAAQQGIIGFAWRNVGSAAEGV